MDPTTQLVPLVCSQCSTSIPAEPDECAWVCTQCGQGLALIADEGLRPISVSYQEGILPGQRGRPYWVANGQVTLRRETYRRTNSARDAEKFWSEARRFFIPAFPLNTEALLQSGIRLLNDPLALNPGPVAPFEPVTLGLEDLQPVAEFIVLAVEAGRKDALKTVDFRLTLARPALWILP